MAYIPEKMDENKISFLANEIARTYMQGKVGDIEDFVNSYLSVYEASKKIIAERENKRIANMTNISWDDVLGSDTETHSKNASLFK